MVEHAQPAERPRRRPRCSSLPWLSSPSGRLWQTPTLRSGSHRLCWRPTWAWTSGTATTRPTLAMFHPSTPEPPYIRSRTADGANSTYVHTLSDGTWTQLDFSATLRDAFQSTRAPSVPAGRAATASSSTPGPRLQSAHRAPQQRQATQRAHGLVGLLPHLEGVYAPRWLLHDRAVGRSQRDRRTAVSGLLAAVRGPYAGHRGHRYALWVTQPRLDGQNLVVPTPTLVTTACLGLSKDSGGSSLAVHARRLHLVRVARELSETAPGVPQYVACYDHLTGSVSTPQLLAVRHPATTRIASPASASTVRASCTSCAAPTGPPCRTHTPSSLTRATTAGVPRYRCSATAS